jgi:hypothetical protein
MDLGEILLGRNSNDVVKARDRARSTWPGVAGFLPRLHPCCIMRIRFWPVVIVLPAGFALVALALGVATNLRHSVPCLSMHMHVWKSLITGGQAGVL